MNQSQTRGHLLALFTVCVWGTTFISTKVLLQVFTPVEILFCRFVLGFLALCLADRRRLGWQGKERELLFAAAGLCGVTLYYLLENIALTYSTASNVGVIVSVSPCFIALFSKWFLHGEPLKPTFFAGFGAAILGILLITVSGGTQLQLNPLGDLLALLAAAIWGVYSILTRKIGGYGYGTVQSTRRIFGYGLLFMLPFLFVFGFRPDFTLLRQPAYLGNLLFLGVCACALCFATWNQAVKLLGAVKTGVYIYLVPVITVVASALVLHERVTLAAAGGMVLTLAGLVLSEWRGRKKPGEPAEKESAATPT